MKINFQLPPKEEYMQCCTKCHSKDIKRIFEGEKTFYYCDNCQEKYSRMIVIDPKIVWWIDTDTKDYWHESVGVFVFNKDNKILFFERVIFPFAFTIPAGHLDTGEEPKTAAIRELSEETGLKIDNISLFKEEDVIGDKCRRGSDHHHWHLYTAQIDNQTDVTICDEGIKPVWLTIEEALTKDLTYPARYFIQKYRNELIPQKQ